MQYVSISLENKLYSDQHAQLNAIVIIWLSVSVPKHWDNSTDLFNRNLMEMDDVIYIIAKFLPIAERTLTISCW